MVKYEYTLKTTFGKKVCTIGHPYRSVKSARAEAYDIVASDWENDRCVYVCFGGDSIEGIVGATKNRMTWKSASGKYILNPDGSLGNSIEW